MISWALRAIIALAVALLFFFVVLWLLGMFGVVLPHTVVVLLAVIIGCCALLYGYREWRGNAPW